MVTNLTFDEFVKKHEITANWVYVSGNSEWTRTQCSLMYNDKLLISTPFGFGIGYATQWAQKNPSKFLQYDHHLRDLIKNPPKYPRKIRADYTPYWEAISLQFVKHAPKSVADVLNCLQRDVAHCDETFENWCFEWGYDPDSRNAFAGWETSNRDRRTLRDNMGPDMWAEFLECEE